MDVRRLEILRVLAERGTVGAVADVMGVTPSAISQQLKLLEKEAGVPLAEPSGRGIALTSAGRQLARTATSIAVAIAKAEADWAEYRSRPAGDVTVATFASGGEMLLPGLLNRAQAEPMVRLDCHDLEPGPRADFTKLVPEFDIVIADTHSAANTWVSEHIHVVPLMSEPLDVALPKGHRLAERSTLTPADVVTETWIGTPSGYPFDRVLTQLAAVTGESISIAQRISDNSTVAALVAAGHGIAILPRFTTRGHRNGLVTVPLIGLRARRDISALVRPDRFERPSIRFVIGALRQEARAVADAHESV